MGRSQVNSVQISMSSMKDVWYASDKKTTERTKRLSLHLRDSHSRTAEAMNPALYTHQRGVLG